MKNVTTSYKWVVVLGVLIHPLTSKALVIENSSGPFSVQVDYFETVGQSFTAEFTDLTSIAFYYLTMNPGASNDPFTMFLYEGAGVGGPQLGSVSFSLPYSPPGNSTYGYYDADFSSIDLVIGSVYTAGVRVDGTSPLWGLAWGGDTYTGGQLYSGNPNNFCGDGATCDLRFRVIGEAGAVDVPTATTLPLLGLAIAALGYSRRKRKPLANPPSMQPSTSPRR